MGRRPDRLVRAIEPEKWKHGGKQDGKGLNARKIGMTFIDTLNYLPSVPRIEDCSAEGGVSTCRGTTGIPSFDPEYYSKLAKSYIARQLQKAHACDRLG
jgi:hypothetical protein